MSLQDEIFNLLKQDWLTQQEPMDYRLDLQAMRIVGLIEKRIDSKLITLKKLNPTEKEIVFTQGYNSAIYGIGELLK